MRHVTTLKVASAAAVMAFTLAACSTSSDSETEPTASAAGSATAEAGASNEELSVAFIQGVIGDNFYISMECGVRAAAEEIGGVDVSVQGGQDGGRDKQARRGSVHRAQALTGNGRQQPPGEG